MRIRAGIIEERFTPTHVGKTPGLRRAFLGQPIHPHRSREGA